MSWKKVDIKVAESRVRKKSSRRVKSIAELVNDALNALEYSLNHDSKKNRKGNTVNIRKVWRYNEKKSRVDWCVKYSSKEVGHYFYYEIFNEKEAKQSIRSWISTIKNEDNNEYNLLKKKIKQIYEAKSARLRKSIKKRPNRVIKNIDKPGTCINYGCNRVVAFSGSRYRAVCSNCHVKGYTNGNYQLGITPYRKKRCSNKQSRLGFSCTLADRDIETITDIDHIDGNYMNNILDNVQELCKKCHVRKTKMNGDNLIIKRIS